MSNPYNAGIISDEVADPCHDTSYTGQIATLQRDLAEARAKLARIARAASRGTGPQPRSIPNTAADKRLADIRRIIDGEFSP